ncbi:hypothetical protein HOL34_01740, partial [bacterium]|nr:hypothetical protein [bacterium]
MKRLFLAMLVAVGLIAIGNAVNKNSSKGSASSSSNSPLSNIKNIVNKDSQESVQDLIKEQQKVVMRLYWDQDEQK